MTAPTSPAMDADAPAARPLLAGDAFERAFPFHLLVGPDGRVRAFGRSLAKVAPTLQAGQPWQHLHWIERGVPHARCPHGR